VNDLGKRGYCLLAKAEALSLMQPIFRLREIELSKTKDMIAHFVYAEKLKSDLILTASLLEVLKDMTDEEIAGAEKLLIAYLNALTGEANIARNVSGVRSFQDVSLKINMVVEQVKQHNYADAVKLVSEAISLVTTSGHQAAYALKEKDLI
jgi:hypothetical protein